MNIRNGDTLCHFYSSLEVGVEEAQHAVEGSLGAVVDLLLPDISPDHPAMNHVSVFSVDTFSTKTHYSEIGIVLTLRIDYIDSRSDFQTFILVD